jgi:(p)ppGpp synthase/HD superfamily hydrolase
MANIETALQIAVKAHEGQKDKSGEPYILHPLRAMQRVQGEEAMIVAVLHDVIEGMVHSRVTLARARFVAGNR